MGLYPPRSVLPFGDQQDVNTLKFDPIAEAAFCFASVTFGVRAIITDVSEAEITLDRSALQRTTQM